MIETNELTRTLKTLLIPKAALIAYTSENERIFFLEVRDIDDRGNMTEGRPVTLEFMNELVKGYSERHGSTPYGKIPSNLMYCDSRKGSERYVWYNPPGKRMMFFGPELKIDNAEYNLPGVIYEAGGTRDEYICLQGRYTRQGYATICRTVLQRDRIRRMSGFCQFRETERYDLRKAAAILGKEILADGVLPLGRQRKPDPI